MKRKIPALLLALLLVFQQRSRRRGGLPLRSPVMAVRLLEAVLLRPFRHRLRRSDARHSVGAGAALRAGRTV